MNEQLWEHWLDCRTPLSMCPRCLGVRKNIRAAKRHCPLATINQQQEFNYAP